LMCLFNADIYILENYKLKSDSSFYKTLIVYFLCLGRYLINLFVNLILTPISYRFMFLSKIRFFFLGEFYFNFIP
jgi:hypothetical protein